MVKIADWLDLESMAPGSWALRRLADLGLQELATYAYDEGTRQAKVTRLLIATDVGLFDVEERLAPPGQAGPGSDVWQTEGRLYPWASVSEPRLVISELTGRRGLAVEFSLAEPAFKRAEGATIPQAELPRTGLRDLAIECVRRAGAPDR